MKRSFKLIALCICTIMILGSCSVKTESLEQEKKLMIGLVTDNGRIDDKSYTQGAWEGIKLIESKSNIQSIHLDTKEGTEAAFLSEIGNVYDSGYKFIITPGIKFETAVFKAQDKYEDAKFVLIDGVPNNGNGESVIKNNSIAILFAEEQAGFLAGLATALELNEGELGFIGGMEVATVKRFNTGFKQGVAYANETYGTKMNIKDENNIYIGSFDNAYNGKLIASQMYNSGVKAIFTAAGASGNGVISEAKNRSISGNEAWVIGVDVDQYSDGIYEEEKSIILTSAIKNVNNAVAQVIDDELSGKFKGGGELLLDIKADGVGIPKENPNLSEDTIAKVNEVITKIKNDEIIIKSE